MQAVAVTSCAFAIVNMCGQVAEDCATANAFADRLAAAENQFALRHLRPAARSTRRLSLMTVWFWPAAYTSRSAWFCWLTPGPGCPVRQAPLAALPYSPGCR